MYEYLRIPWSAALIAALVTVAYIKFKTNLNGQKEVPNHEYVKPAFLVGVLVYFIIHFGMNDSEPILKNPML